MLAYINNIKYKNMAFTILIATVVNYVTYMNQLSGNVNF